MVPKSNVVYDITNNNVYDIAYDNISDAVSNVISDIVSNVGIFNRAPTFYTESLILHQERKSTLSENDTRNIISECNF